MIDSMRKKIWLAGGAVPTLLIVYLLLSWFWPLGIEQQVVAIKPGRALAGVTRDLYDLQILPDRFSFRVLASLTGSSKKIKAGEYRLEPGMSQRQILSMFVDGRQVVYSVLAVEGSTFSDFLQSLATNEKIDFTLSGLTPVQIMERLSYGQQHPEGRFFPDTYTFTAGTKDIDLLRQAYFKMKAELEKMWQERDENLPYRSIDEALIMASIIEKETGRPEDRTRIAAVFVNRLRKGMRLQTDPTVIYGMGRSFDGNLRKKDLLKDGPYNTYTRRGLPPTPISLPGRESLYAALHPAPTNDLYFVSRGDGSSHFSETYKEHERAVHKYQLGGNKQGAGQK